MKKAYTIALTALAILVLSWFLPWLYSLALPDGGNDPFIAWSPISRMFVVSENLGDDGTLIYAADSQGNHIPDVKYTREQRDSLLPHVYFTQLSGRNALPDTICGKPASMAAFKHSQWVLNSSPRDINRPSPDVWMMMESMPERFDLEDAEEVFSLDGDRVTFTAMADNKVVDSRSRRFTKAFADAGFVYPPRFLNANVTTRKAYDEGYLIVDGAGKLFHVKMQAGRPYMASFRVPDSVSFTHAFILENQDTRYLGLAADSRGHLYALEHEGYRAVPLPVPAVDLTRQRVTVMKNMYNWVIKVSDDDSGTVWTAFDTDTYGLLGTYSFRRNPSEIAVVRQYIFPYIITFTDLTDRYVRPRVTDISLRAIYLNVALALLLFVILWVRRKPGTTQGAGGADALESVPTVTPVLLSKLLVTVVFGIFAFIPFAVLKD